MSGLGRDWPSGTVVNWPKDMYGGGPPPTNGLPFPDHASLYKAISNTMLVSPPFSYPAYSNTGTGLLGMALVAANRAASENPAHEPVDYAALIKRDVFDTMGLNGSHFLMTEANKHLVVVPSFAPEVAVCPEYFFPLPYINLAPIGPRLSGCHESSWRPIFVTF